MITFQAPEPSPPPLPFEEPPIVERIASAMREMAFAGQTVTREALALRGFRLADIDRHGMEAADFATATSIRRVA